MNDPPLPPKSWDQAMEECNKLMQIVHVNNVEFHKVLRKNKDEVDIVDIKEVFWLINLNPPDHYLIP